MEFRPVVGSATNKLTVLDVIDSLETHHDAADADDGAAELERGAV